MGDRLGRAGPRANQPSGVTDLSEVYISTVGGGSGKAAPAAAAAAVKEEAPKGCCACS